MTRYKLPNDAIDGIAHLGRIAPVTATALAAELEQSLDISFSFTDQVNRLVADSRTLNGSSVSRAAIADAITGLHYLKLGMRNEPDQVAEAIEAAFKATSSHGLTPDQVGDLLSNVQSFLQIKKLSASVKSWSLRSDHQNVFVRSRIFTDVRPVFDDQLSNPLLASVLTHTVKISFQANGRPESLFLVADSEDLKELQKDIARALEKARHIAKLIDKERFGPALDQDSE